MEHKSNPLISTRAFVKRLGAYGLLAFLLILFSVLLGMVGYHHFAQLTWIDSFHMSCLILTGMGPTNEMPSVSAKLFSSIFALYSGVSFLTIAAILFSPIIHRILHVLHLEDLDKDE